jgi:hypothetical protein
MAVDGDVQDDEKVDTVYMCAVVCDVCVFLPGADMT